MRVQEDPLAEIILLAGLIWQKLQNHFFIKNKKQEAFEQSILCLNKYS